MPVDPSLTLTLGTDSGHGEFARHLHERKEVWRLACGSQIQPKFHIFNNAAGRKLRAIDNVPWENHSATHQLNRAAKISQAERTRPVLQDPGKLGEAVVDRRVLGTMHQIESLDGPPDQLADQLHAMNKINLQPAIRVHKENKVRRVGLKMGDAPPHCVSLADSRRLIASGYFHILCRCDG